MSIYTTGEIARLCGVTVRTVQYYDNRGILIPSQLSEGGRRLYSEEDLKQMKVICYLRDLGLPINAIAELLTQEHPEKVIDLLLSQQSEALRDEILDRQEKLAKLTALQKELKTRERFSVETIGDIAKIMENRKNLHRLCWIMLGVGMISEAVEITTVLLWILKGIWWPFLFVGLPVMVAIGIWISRYYFVHVSYICPECHGVFQPVFKEAFWANHTPTTRKLTCPACGHRGFCVETYGGKE